MNVVYFCLRAVKCILEQTAKTQAAIFLRSVNEYQKLQTVDDCCLKQLRISREMITDVIIHLSKSTLIRIRDHGT